MAVANLVVETEIADCRYYQRGKDSGFRQTQLTDTDRIMVLMFWKCCVQLQFLWWCLKTAHNRKFWKTRVGGNPEGTVC